MREYGIIQGEESTREEVWAWDGALYNFKIQMPSGRSRKVKLPRLPLAGNIEWRPAENGITEAKRRQRFDYTKQFQMVFRF